MLDCRPCVATAAGTAICKCEAWWQVGYNLHSHMLQAIADHQCAALEKQYAWQSLRRMADCAAELQLSVSGVRVVTLGMSWPD